MHRFGDWIKRSDVTSEGVTVVCAAVTSDMRFLAIKIYVDDERRREEKKWKYKTEKTKRDIYIYTDRQIDS